MRRRDLTGLIISCIIVLALGLTSIGFAQQKSANDAYKWPKMLVVGTQQTAATTFAIANAWTPVLEATTGMSVRVVPDASNTIRFVRLTKGEFDLYDCGGSDASCMYHGEAGLAAVEPELLGAIWHLVDMPFGYGVAGDSPYKSIWDLKTKGPRIAYATGVPSVQEHVKKGMPALIGWTPEEAAKNWTFVPIGSWAGMIRSICDGKADVSVVSTTSNVAYELSGHPRGLRFLEADVTDTKMWGRLLDFRGGLIPAKMEHGVPSAIGSDGYTSIMMWQTTLDKDPELVYNLAKWIDQNFDKYKGNHVLAPRMALKTWRKYLNYSAWPVHEGTVRYLREIGQWTEKDDEWNNAAIALAKRWVAARKAAINEAKSKNVPVEWNNQDYLDIMKKHTADIPKFRVRI